jgi:hypothetical protein
MRDRRASPSNRAVAFVVAAALELCLVLAMFGFTVDDALIPARYAHHLAIGAGYVMNRGGPSTDGVTPLGFAHLLAPFARGGALEAHVAAKWIGAVATSLGAGFVGWAAARTGGSRLRASGLVALFGSLPLAAWGASGMETGLAAGLVAAGVSLRISDRGHGVATWLLGLAAGLRPELLPMAVVLATPRGPGARGALALGGDHAARAAVATLPFVVVAGTRAVVFGRAAPLSSVAKAPDLALGGMYALACFLLAGPVALALPIGWSKLGGYARWLVVAVAVHLAAVAFAGGDWMPLSRLLVPAVPVVALALVELARVSSPWASVARALAVAGTFAFVWVGQAKKAASVEADRAALIERARPILANARAVASLDVGWVGVAAPDAVVVDLAGVTDPSVAILPGGHTSKHLPPGFLEDRGVDAITLLVAPGRAPSDPWTETPFARNAEYTATWGLRDPAAFHAALFHDRTPRYLVVVKGP